MSMKKKHIKTSNRKRRKRSGSSNSIISKIAIDIRNYFKKITSGDKKKMLLMSVPYIMFGYFFDKIAWLYRISSGVDMTEKVLYVLNYFEKAFSNPLPSLYYQDLGFGICCGLVVKGIVYYKKKSAKKFRQGMEYGSARWGTEEDIRPYMDNDFENNVLLTETERLTMGKPSAPKYARNKNIVVVGGSGASGIIMTSQAKAA